jgi:Domain of unknown function (DUF4338)
MARAAAKPTLQSRPRTRPRRQPAKVVRFPFGKARLRSLIEDAAESFWTAVAAGDKDVIRAIHVASRDHGTDDQRRAALKLFEKYRQRFIDGANLDPARIQPVLIYVDDRHGVWGDLFRLVRWTWSMPYSSGYGRRLRFVVWDAHHEAVMGIIGLQSPPVDLAARDGLFAYPKGRKLEFVNRTLDAFTIGAVPPYSNILGGKLVAGLVASNEVRQAYWRVYAGKITQMKRKRIAQPLVAVTTTSAFGRSSIYNRLRHGDRLLAESIGYTKGTGSVHLEPFYPHILDLIRTEEPDLVVGDYGNGPKRKWQHFKRGLDMLGVHRRFFNHGLQREVFLYRLVENLDAGMSGGESGAALDMSTADHAAYWRERWAIPRSERDPSWRDFAPDAYFRNAILQDQTF